MTRPRVDPDEARALAGEALGTDDLEVEEVPVGFGNHNWRVRSAAGDFILKIGPAASAAKWTAAAVGAQRAREAALAIPAVRYHANVGEHVVRMFEWVDGRPAKVLEGSPEAQARLGADLGAAVAQLHAAEWPWFGSRLDAGAATFDTWPGYVAHRLGEIEARAVANAAPAPDLRARAGAIITELANDVSTQCRPVVCHRDLHADNLLVEADGTLAAIVDWDMPEAWDAAGEWFKLEAMLFVDLPHARDAFEAAYAARHPAQSRWEDRKRVIHLIENLNVVANAGHHDPAFVAAGVARLERLI